LGLKPIKTETLRLNTFGQPNYRKEKCSVVKLCLKKREQEIDLVALDYPVICSPLPTKVCIEHPHLEGLELADDCEGASADIDILVGSDYYWELARGEDGPTAVASKLGWLLSGPLGDTEESSNLSVSNLIIAGNCNSPENATLSDPIVEALRQFWDVETAGVIDKTPPYDQVIDDIRFDKDRYVVGLPWSSKL
jgi:hypothetical protein